MVARRQYNDRYRQFLTAVWSRDRGRCQYPGCKKKGAQVHHITRWVDNPLKRYNPTNGILLCVSCHKSITGKELSYASIFREIVLRKYG